MPRYHLCLYPTLFESILVQDIEIAASSETNRFIRTVYLKDLLFPRAVRS